MANFWSLVEKTKMFLNYFIPYSLKSQFFFFFQSAKGGLQFGFTLVSWFFGGFTVSTSFKLPSSVTVGKNSSSKLSMVDTDPVSLLAN